MTDDLQKLLAGMVKPLEWVPFGERGFKTYCHLSMSSFYVSSGDDCAQIDKERTARIASTLNLDAVLALVAAQRDDAKTIDDAADQISAMNTELVRLSNDPAAVYANMQCGAIAKPSWDDVLKLYPNESAALVAAAYDQIQSAVYEMRKEAGQQANGVRFQALDDVRDMIRNMGQEPTAALARMLSDARAEGLEMALGAVNGQFARLPYFNRDTENNLTDKVEEGYGNALVNCAAAIRAMKGEQG